MHGAFGLFARGAPDLVLWRCETGEVLAMEVKGPGDQLRPSQEACLVTLNRDVGIPAQVCYVSARDAGQSSIMRFVHRQPK